MNHPFTLHERLRNQSLGPEHLFVFDLLSFQSNSIFTMTEPLLSVLFQQLTTIIETEVRQQVRLVVGVESRVQKLRSNLLSLEAVLEDAEKRQWKESTVKVWLTKLKDIAYDIDDLLDDWNTALTKKQFHQNSLVLLHKVRSLFFSPCLAISQVTYRHDIAVRLKEIDEKLSLIATEKDMYNFIPIKGKEEPDYRSQTTSFADVSDIRGRDNDKNLLLTKLMSSENPTDLQIVSIVGMGGIGKTTLAQLIYNDMEVISHFEKRMWVCVSDPFDEVKVAKTILESLHVNAPTSVELQTHLIKIHQIIAGKKFLLILDDVWTENRSRWEQLYCCLKCGAHGSRVLVTTRKETVSLMMGSTYMITLGSLSAQDSWSLFSRIAFFGRSDKECDNLEAIARSIVGKCKGLPLAAKTLGSLLRFKRSREEWQSIMNSDLWALEAVEKGVFPPLLLSYYDLHPTLRRCFSYCAVFPKDYVINRNDMIKLWMAEGYLQSTRSTDLEMIGEEYFDNLAMRSFFQDFEKDHDGGIIRCKMHDIVHDVAQFLTKTECLLVDVGSNEEPNVSLSLGKARHSLITVPKQIPFPVTIDNGKKLRTLLVNYVKALPVEEWVLFDQLKCIKALHLSMSISHGIVIETLPRQIGKLIHLRYLNLSCYRYVKVLPESICDLCNLQTLNISHCSSLKVLPLGIGKLINLRHLENDETGLIFMPRGIMKLVSLRTLAEFVINAENATSLGYLKHLNHLRGNLRITGLGYVVELGKAKEAELKSKKDLTGLVLDFSGCNNCQYDLLEALELPTNLERLEISNYRGTALVPDLIMSLTKLRALRLFDCDCEQLPPLQKLLYLESLSLQNIKVKKLGFDFFGISIDGTTKNNQETIVSFPSLKKLQVSEMHWLNEWDYGITSTAIIMPILRFLEFQSCPGIDAVPSYLLHQLEELHIRECPLLHRRYNRETGEDWFRISHIPNITICD